MTVPEPSAHDDAFIDLLIDSGLATAAQVTDALKHVGHSNHHLDEFLVANGTVDAERLRRVMAMAWGLPPIDLASGWIDEDLVRSWEARTYVDEQWMPVRDQANGSVLVATARIPDASRVEELLLSPVEFAVTTSADIRAAVLWSFTGQRSGAFQGSFSRVIARLRRPWGAVS